MEGETLPPPPPGEMATETQPPPAKRARGNQPPAAEEEGEAQQPAAEMEGEMQAPPLPAEVEGEALPPPAEMGGETQPPQAEMEGEMQPPRMPACVSKVLDDDNLLAEIIVRVGFPRTSLVRAAAVCRRWLLLASDRAFLRRFRKLHPPWLLGFYRAQWPYPDTVLCFFPVLPQPPPPELAAVVRRASFSLDTYKGKHADMVGCWNGRVVNSLHLWYVSDVDDSGDIKFEVHRPLSSERGMAAIPALHLPFQKGYFRRCRHLFSKEEGDILSYIYLLVESTNDGTKSTVHVYMLQNGDDAWRRHLSLAADYPICASPDSVLVDDKIYMASAGNEIVVLDLTASSFSTIQLPQGVDFLTEGTTMLSRADDASDVYLIRAKELQLNIWLHKGGNWLLVDNICLLEMCAPFLEDEPTAILRINHMGDYTADFLFLEMGRYALHLDVKCRTLRKVHEKTKKDRCCGNIYPFMMIWPPIFPALKDAPASNVPHEGQGQEEA